MGMVMKDATDEGLVPEWEDRSGRRVDSRLTGRKREWTWIHPVWSIYPLTLPDPPAMPF